MSDLTVEQARTELELAIGELGGARDMPAIIAVMGTVTDGIAALIAAAKAKGRAEERERGAAEKARYFRWAYRLLVALAKRILKERHNDDGNWPMRMEWHELAPSSCGVFLRAARYEAGVEHEAFLDVVRSGDIEISDIYDGDAPSENPALSSPTTEEARNG